MIFPGTKILRKGEEFTVGNESGGKVTIKDGEAFKLDIFDKIEAEAIKRPGQGIPSALNPLEIKTLGIPPDQAKIMEKIRTENPEMFRNLLRSYAEKAKARVEEIRKGKKEKMTQDRSML